MFTAWHWLKLLVNVDGRLVYKQTRSIWCVARWTPVLHWTAANNTALLLHLHCAGWMTSRLHIMCPMVQAPWCKQRTDTSRMWVISWQRAPATAANSPRDSIRLGVKYDMYNCLAFARVCVSDDDKKPLLTTWLAERVTDVARITQLTMFTRCVIGTRLAPTYIHTSTDLHSDWLQRTLTSSPTSAT